MTVHRLISMKGTNVMRILVIGGTRFMGPLVMRSLSKSGHEVTVFHRGQTRTDLPRGVKEFLGDRSSLTESAVELQRLAPEVVLYQLQRSLLFGKISILIVVRHRGIKMILKDGRTITIRFSSSVL